MNKINKLPLIALLAFAASWAGDESATMERPHISASQTSMVTAVVEEINHETRDVTVRRDDGELISFTVSEEARNLGQVSVGDVLKVEVQETLSIQVMANDGSEPEAMEAAAMARTEEGEMPGFAAMDTIVVTATVEEINIEANTFKLKGPDGNINEFVARNPDNLKRAMVGDLVVITTTEAIAIVVEKHVEE